MSQKTYLAILKGGIWLAFLSFFFVFKQLLFPYITSKQIYFNILIEILTVFWLAFIIKYPEWRPKKPYIAYGWIAFFIAAFISAVHGVDFNMSFWGNIERMLGLFHVFHFLLFYFILITVMREKKDWLVVFNLSVAAAVIISIYSYSVHFSTIGNTAYVSGYLIFNIYFAVLLMTWNKNWIMKALYIIALIIMLPVFWSMKTSGAYVGLGFSVLVMIFLFGILNKNKKVKVYTLSAFLILAIFTAAVFLDKRAGFVRETPVLKQITTLISTNKNTFHTRLFSWLAAYEDFHNHPILGTGYGNFAITFDKFFSPDFYNYTNNETYFDRAHNNIIDIASTTGAAGLLAYLSIWVAVGYYLIDGYKKKKIAINDFVLVVSLLVAYFVQNLAIFDSLVTYVSFMITLAFLNWLHNGEKVEAKNREFNNKEFYSLLGIGIVVFFIMYQYNIKPLKMLVGTINGQMAYAEGDMVQTEADYKQALSYNTVLDRDSRTSYIRLILQNPSLLNSLDRAKAQEILDFGVQLGEANLKYNPRDSLRNMEFAELLNIAANFNYDNRQKFDDYVTRAEKAIDQSIASSPGRVPVYFVKAQIYLTEGKKEEAFNIFKYAISLNENYPDGYCQIARLYLYDKDETDGYQYMDKCLDLGGISTINDSNTLQEASDHYVTEKDWGRLVKIYQQATTLEPKNAKIWADLAQFYLNAGKKNQAKAAALQAAKLDPSLQSAAEQFINSLGL